MEIKWTLQGLLIYGVMASYVVAFVLFMMKRRGPARRVWLGGFLVALAAVIYRGIHTGHVPLQNMFEVFLVLGALVFPLSWLCRRYLGVPGESADVLAGLAILIPAGFVFSARPEKLPPALQSSLFAPHVMAYLLAYVILIKAALLAAPRLFGVSVADGDTASSSTPATQHGHRLVRLGFPLLTLGLVLGAWWGKLAWGDYWNWDPKELWSLATWLVYVAYFHVHAIYSRKFPGLNCAFVTAGAVCVVLTLVWVNLAGALFSGLHTYA
jgi:ABC-type transport system involved in cytochrome c biogenesis permease subunit